MRVHELKCLPPFFEEVLNRRKTHEVRKNDRSFELGDAILLQEWTEAAPPVRPASVAGYTGRQVYRRITYISRPGPFTPLAEGYVILSLSHDYPSPPIRCDNPLCIDGKLPSSGFFREELCPNCRGTGCNMRLA